MVEHSAADPEKCMCRWVLGDFLAFSQCISFGFPSISSLFTTSRSEDHVWLLITCIHGCITAGPYDHLQFSSVRGLFGSWPSLALPHAPQPCVLWLAMHLVAANLPHCKTTSIRKKTTGARSNESNDLWQPQQKAEPNSCLGSVACRTLRRQSVAANQTTP